MSFEISHDDLSDGTVIKLLQSHLSEMYKYSPPESIHALDAHKLKDPSMTFWAARINGELAGCGALKELTIDSAEIKSMKTNLDYLRQGIASKLLNHIVTEAANRGYKSLYLETGSHKAFQPAIELYLKNGFVECEHFGDYKLDPYSRFYRLFL